MKTMTLDELKQMPPPSDEEILAVKNFVNKDFSDCPKQTKEELARFRPWHEVCHWGGNARVIEPQKKSVQIKIDEDVLNALKMQGRGYQTKINAILRKAVFG